MEDAQVKILEVYDAWVEKKQPMWMDYLAVGDEAARIRNNTGIDVQG